MLDNVDAKISKNETVVMPVKVYEEIYKKAIDCFVIQPQSEVEWKRKQTNKTKSNRSRKQSNKQANNKKANSLIEKTKESKNK